MSIIERPMIISVDYDGTYSADPATFDLIISEFQQNGHKVIIVTARGDNEPVTINPNLDLEVFYTEGTDKDPYMRDKHDIDVDIWVEDRPQSVGKVDNWIYNREERYWYQTCDACDGIGQHNVPVRRTGHDSMIYSNVTCTDCGGSGEWVPSS